MKDRGLKSDRGRQADNCVMLFVPVYKLNGKSAGSKFGKRFVVFLYFDLLKWPELDARVYLGGKKRAGTYFLRLKQATHIAAVNAPRNTTQPRMMVIASRPDRIVFSLRCVRISLSVLEESAKTLIGSRADFTSDSLSFRDLQKARFEVALDRGLLSGVWRSLTG